MEHLLPPGTPAPMRVYPIPPSAPNQPPLDDDETIQLMKSILGMEQPPPDNKPNPETPCWNHVHEIEQTRPNALCWLVQQFIWFVLVREILGNVSGPRDFIDFGKERDEHQEKSEEDEKEAENDEGEDDGEAQVPYLHTGKLEAVLALWKDQVDQMAEEEKAKLRRFVIMHLEQAAVLLKKMSMYIHFRYEYHRSPDGRPIDIDHDLLGRVHFFCVLMHQALTCAGSKVLGISGRAGNPLSLRQHVPWLLYKMEYDGWCRYTRWRLNITNDVEEMVWAYFLGTVRVGDGHEKCTNEVCYANAMRDDALPTHVEEGCGCKIVEPPLEDMLDVLRKGDVPVLRISKHEGDNIRLEMRRMSEERKYVAISHVWADGLGSPTSNSIASCQLERIAERLKIIPQLPPKDNEKEHGTREDVYGNDLCIWADTLCIPVDPSHLDLRHIQINKMHDIYKNASHVLVLDPDFLPMTSEAGISELGMRIYLSAWCSRLWTYQEGAYCDSILLITNSGLVDLDATLKVREIVKTEKSVLSNQLEDIMTRATVFTTGRPYYDASPDVTYPEDENEFFATMDQIMKKGDAEAQRLLYAIRDRTSSRPDDEAVIIAASMGIDTLPILQAELEDRMVALIKTMPQVPANLLFTVGKRLTKKGFRWAPHSLLRARDANSCGPVQSLVPLTEEEFDTGVRTVRFMSELHGGEDVDGLLTFNPSIGLKKVLLTGRTFTVEMLGTMYSFSLVSDDLTNETPDSERMRGLVEMLEKGKDMAILLPEFDPNHRMYHGVLIEVLEDTGPFMEKPDVRGQNRPKNPSKARFMGCIQFDATRSQSSMWTFLEKDGDLDAIKECQADWMNPRFWLID